MNGTAAALVLCLLLSGCDGGSSLNESSTESKAETLLYLGGVEMISPWEYDKCREEYIEACGSADCFDNGNYARNQPL